jgi:predicted nucleotide-binding protein
MIRLLKEFLTQDEMHSVQFALDASTDSILKSDNREAYIAAFCEHCSYCIAQLRICKDKIMHFSTDSPNRKDDQDHISDSELPSKIQCRNASIRRQDAIQLIDKYIFQFKKAKEYPAPRANPYYEGAIHGVCTVLTELFDKNEALRFVESITSSADLIKSSSELEVVSHYFYLHIDTCIAVLDSYKDKIQLFHNNREHSERIIPATKKVFIVHGHDHTNLLIVRDLIGDRYALSPIILAEKASKGRTLIEKFEDEASHAAFAFAVMTPDDLIQAKTGEYLQSRPNVIFEVGWFYGRLGRGRVCILLKEGTKIHSDLDGISRIEFSTSVEEKIVEIESELLAAGLITNRAE